VLAENRGEPLDVLIVLSHHALADTRGAALSVVLVDPADRVDLGVVSVSWVGVGNVFAALIETTPTGAVVRSEAPLAPGIVGYRLPSSMHARTESMRPGDLLLMTSDGIRGNPVDVVDMAKPTEQICREVMRRRAKDSDDAVVLAARHRGTPP
jgi:hypothetical protein